MTVFQVQSSRPPSFEEDDRSEQDVANWPYVEQPVEELGIGETQGAERVQDRGSRGLVSSAADAGDYSRAPTGMDPPFANRALAAQLLAVYLRHYVDAPGAVVLGLPRGGVAVAHEIALALRLRMKALLVRKLRVPRHPELAFGSICSTGHAFIDQDMVNAYHLKDWEVEKILKDERWELEKRAHLYGDHSAFPDVRGKTVILVDDGIATGATMLAAIHALRESNPAKIVAAAPVGSAFACELLEKEADEVVCALRPRHFKAVGIWYKDFSPVKDTEVLALLRQHRHRS